MFADHLKSGKQNRKNIGFADYLKFISSSGRCYMHTSVTFG